MQEQARVTAILKTTDMAATIAWYEAAGFDLRCATIAAYEAAGFEQVHPNDRPAIVAGDGQPKWWCEVERDGLVLQFLGGDATPWPGDPAFTGCFYVHPTSVEAVYADLDGRIEAEWGIEMRPWGARELTLQDPNGYYIVFTEDGDEAPE